MARARTTLADLNRADRDRFVAVVGPLFEQSPWIAERVFLQRPFATREQLHQALCETVRSAGPARQLDLIRAHPDLVGRAAREGTLTPESRGEQASAGLDRLTADTAARFEAFNGAYRDRFGFPFVICVRENKCATILAAFPRRLAHTREQEIEAALAEIEKIAWLRLCDAIDEGQ